MLNTIGVKMKTTRRTFMTMSIAGVTALALNKHAQAQAMLSPADPQAAALGYNPDVSKVDKAKFPKYAAPQACGNCALYQGGAAATGGCPLYPGKQVSIKGWCSAYNKKA